MRQNFCAKDMKSHRVLTFFIFMCERKFFDDSILHGAVLYYSTFLAKKGVDVAA